MSPGLTTMLSTETVAWFTEGEVVSLNIAIGEDADDSLRAWSMRLTLTSYFPSTAAIGIPRKKRYPLVRAEGIS